MKELVTNGNFSAGNKGFQADYTHVNGPPGSMQNVSTAYDVDKSPALAANAFADWADFGDHTTGHGKMMCVNGGAGDVWREAIALDAGKHYTFSLWARVENDGSQGLANLPQLQFFADGAAIGTSLTLVGPSSAGWQQLTFAFTPTAATSVISIQDLTHDGAYNDFALDDISITKRGGSGASHLDVAAIVGLEAHSAFSPHSLEHLSIA